MFTVGLKYLLDTNILSELSKPQPNHLVLEKIKKVGHQCVTASIVIHELYYGANRLPKSTKKSNLQLFLKQLEKYNFPVLPYDESAAKTHASERVQLVSQGLTPAFVDGQIASIAMVNDLILVTRNTKGFEQFKHLSLENWLI